MNDAAEASHEYSVFTAACRNSDGCDGAIWLTHIAHTDEQVLQTLPAHVLTNRNTQYVNTHDQPNKC